MAKNLVVLISMELLGIDGLDRSRSAHTLGHCFVLPSFRQDGQDGVGLLGFVQSILAIT